MSVASRPSTYFFVKSSSSSFQGEESYVSSSYSSSIRPPWLPPKVFCNFFQMMVNRSHAFRNATASSLLQTTLHPPPTVQFAWFKNQTNPLRKRLHTNTTPKKVHDTIKVANFFMYLRRLLLLPTHRDKYPPTATTNAPLSLLSGAAS